MATRVNVSKFLRRFSRLVEELGPGEALIVTRRGEAVGEFVRMRGPRRVAMPDFEKLASWPGIPASVGDELFARIMRDM